MINMLEFYQGKRVFITGHTGFKGSYLTKVLTMLGAKVKVYSLACENEFELFNCLNLKNEIESVDGDIRDLQKLTYEINEFQPEIIFHLAAQPLVRESYENPAYTYETNVMGTVNVLEAIRNCKSVKSVVNVTTDKVYENKEWEYGYRENDVLNGFDPYSNSKSCSEIITSSYKKSFFSNRDIAISTARAGNVIGGGDYAKDRIIPDCVRAAQKGEYILVRNPQSIRPYQHVLEAISAYLLIAERQYFDKGIQNSYNVGPDENACVKTSRLVDIFCEKWGNDMCWIDKSIKNAVHESNYLKLDCSRIKNKLDWKPKLNIDEAILMTVEWEKYDLKEKKDITEKQIENYFKV